MNSVIIPIIKNMSEINAAELCKVQPMVAEAGNVFKIKHSVNSEPEVCFEGTQRHSFVNGWERFYHGEWISQEKWLTLKIKGL